MAEKKVTTMVIKFDLECEKCHKKIKKVLCRIPQIQNQIYDKKAGTVTITVVCCSPEKIKENIICKGGEAVKSIEIKVPEKPKPAPEKPKKEEKKKQPDNPKDTVDGNGKPIGPNKPKALIVEPSKPNEPEKLKVVNVEPVHPGHIVLTATEGLVEGHVIMTMAGQHPHVMKLTDGQCMIVGLAAAAAMVAKEAVTMRAEVNMSVKIIPRHAQSCESIKNVDALVWCRYDQITQ